MQSNETVKLTRQELYELVWSNSILALSKKYQISDVGLRKMCLRMEIPIPKAGYWAKLRSGKSVRNKILQDSYKGKSEVSLILRSPRDKDQVTPRAAQASLKAEIESTPSISLIVPKELKEPHPLIVSAKKRLEERIKAWPRILNDGLIQSSRNELDIAVTARNLERAYIFMDTLIKLLYLRGHSIVIKEKQTFIVVYGIEVRMVLLEKLEMRETADRSLRSSFEYHPTNLLCLKIVFSPNPKEWIDGSVPLESLLSKIIAKVEVKGKELKAEKLAIDKYWEGVREKERAERRLQERKEKELADVKGLLRKAKRWEEVKLVRSYLDDVESEAIRRETISDDLKNWIEWARKKADLYDPLVETTDELLQEFDQQTLVRKP